MAPITQSASPASANSPPKKHVFGKEMKYSSFVKMQKKRLKFVMENMGKVKGVNKRGCTKLGTPPPSVQDEPPKHLINKEWYQSHRKSDVLIDSAPPRPLRSKGNTNQLPHEEVFRANTIRHFPETCFKNDPDQYETLKKCAALAIGEYNSNEHTNYRLVDIDKVHWKLVSGVRYYIIFRAKMTPEVVDTFQAIVLVTRVQRSVVGIQINKPRSPWYVGTFRELRK